MGIVILLAGEQIGPFSEGQVRQYLEEGLVSPDDFARLETQPDWQSVAEVFAHLPPTVDRPELPAEQGQAVQTRASPHPETEVEPKSPHVEMAPPVLTPTRKIKRRPGKIVVQPILPASFSVPARGKSRNKTETPAISPPVQIEAPEATPTLAESRAVHPGTPVVTSTPSEPALPVPLPDKPLEELPPGGSSLLPREAVYGLVALAMLLVLATGYSILRHRDSEVAAPRLKRCPRSFQGRRSRLLR